MRLLLDFTLRSWLMLLSSFPAPLLELAVVCCGWNDEVATDEEIAVGLATCE